MIYPKPPLQLKLNPFKYVAVFIYNRQQIPFHGLNGLIEKLLALNVAANRQFR